MEKRGKRWGGKQRNSCSGGAEGVKLGRPLSMCSLTLPQKKKQKKKGESTQKSEPCVACSSCPGGKGLKVNVGKKKNMCEIIWSRTVLQLKINLSKKRKERREKEKNNKKPTHAERVPFDLGKRGRLFFVK